MEVDFSFQLLRRFYIDRLSEELRAEVRAFIKQTNIDTHRHLSRIYDIVQFIDPANDSMVKDAMKEMRYLVDSNSAALRDQGERIMDSLDKAFSSTTASEKTTLPEYNGVSGLTFIDSVFFSNLDESERESARNDLNFFGGFKGKLSYRQFKELQMNN
jgi:hypothetical protein